MKKNFENRSLWGWLAGVALATTLVSSIPVGGAAGGPSWLPGIGCPNNCSASGACCFNPITNSSACLCQPGFFGQPGTENDCSVFNCSFFELNASTCDGDGDGVPDAVEDGCPSLDSMLPPGDGNGDEVPDK